jgi:hypothetical protein
MVEASFTVYHRRARQLAGAMKLCQDGMSAYASAAALLAVHSAISYSDALLIGLGGARPRGENHREAISALRLVCTGAKIEPRGIAHLQKLLSAKTDISYGEKPVNEVRIAALCDAATRFETWVERVLHSRKGRLS